MFTDDGNNTANVDQNEDLDAHATGTTVDQLQNTEFDEVADCVIIEEPEAPNSCSRILMDTDDGNNTLDVDQDNDLSMTVPGGDDDDDDDDDGDDDGDDGGDDGSGGGVADDDDDDNGSNGSSIIGTQQQGSCISVGSCFDGAEPDGGTEAGIDMFGQNGTTSSHASGSATQDMPDNLPLVDQKQFADPFCCFGTIFENDEVDSDIELEVDQDAGVDAFQSGENGLACVAFGDGECSARLVIRNNDGTNVAEGSGQALFGHQKCDYFPPSEETFVIQQNGVCSGPGVITVTTSTTGTGD
jgi:hypothetical protein